MLCIRIVLISQLFISAKRHFVNVSNWHVLPLHVAIFAAIKPLFATFSPRHRPLLPDTQRAATFIFSGSIFASLAEYKPNECNWLGPDPTPREHKLCVRHRILLQSRCLLELACIYDRRRQSSLHLLLLPQRSDYPRYAPKLFQ